MKLLKLKTLFILLAIFSFTSCNKDEIKPLSPEKEIFIGHWQLTHILQDGTQYNAINNNRIIINRRGSNIGDGTYALYLQYRTVDNTLTTEYSSGGNWALVNNDKLVLNKDVEAHYKVTSVTSYALVIERHEKVVKASGKYLMKHRENAINPNDSMHVMTQSPVVYTFIKKK